MVRNKILIVMPALMLLAFGATSRADSEPHRMVRASGIGRAPGHVHGPQARLMAQRAAEVVAARNLAAKVAGVQSFDNGQGDASHRGQWILHGHQFSQPIHYADGSVEVTASLTLPPEQGTAAPGNTRDRHGAVDARGDDPPSIETEMIECVVIDPTAPLGSRTMGVVTMTAEGVGEINRCRACRRQFVCGPSDGSVSIGHVANGGLLCQWHGMDDLERAVAAEVASLTYEIDLEMRATMLQIEAMLATTRAEIQAMAIDFR